MLIVKLSECQPYHIYPSIDMFVSSSCASTLTTFRSTAFHIQYTSKVAPDLYKIGYGSFSLMPSCQFGPFLC